MINRLKSLLCIMLLGCSTHCSPMILNGYMVALTSHKARTQPKAESRGFSLSHALPLLYTLPGLILGGYALWRVTKHENYTKNEVKSLKEGQSTLAERFKKDIDDLQQDIICLNDDISLIIDDIAVLDNDISMLNRKDKLEKYRDLTIRLAEENMLFKEAIGERIDRTIFGLKPRIDSLESKVKNLKHRMSYTNLIIPGMSSPVMNLASSYNSSQTASTPSSGSTSSVESL